MILWLLDLLISSSDQQFSNFFFLNTLYSDQVKYAMVLKKKKKKRQCLFQPNFFNYNVLKLYWKITDQEYY